MAQEVTKDIVNSNLFLIQYMVHQFCDSTIKEILIFSNNTMSILKVDAAAALEAVIR